MTLESEFDLFHLPEEHQELRKTVRALCEKHIAAYAADVDEHARFPLEAWQALTTSGLHAVHIPEAYGGQGADAVATCIVIEEVARVDASAALIPAVNKLALSNTKRPFESRRCQSSCGASGSSTATSP